MGKPSSTCVVTSGGVSTAARIKMIKMAYLRWRRSFMGFTSPTLVSAIITMGISNTRPNTTIMVSVKPM